MIQITHQVVSRSWTYGHSRTNRSAEVGQTRPHSSPVEHYREQKRRAPPICHDLTHSHFHLAKEVRISQRTASTDCQSEAILLLVKDITTHSRKAHSQQSNRTSPYWISLDTRRKPRVKVCVNIERPSQPKTKTPRHSRSTQTSINFDHGTRSERKGREPA